MNLNKFKNLDYKKKIIYLSLVFAVAALLTVYMIIKPTLMKIKEERANIVTQKIELEKRLSNEKNMASLSSKIRKIKPQIDRLSSVYINQGRQLEFITTLEGIASENKVAQSLNLNFDSLSNDPNYNIIPLEISVSGTYANVLNYLISLETMNYYINITNWQFSPGGAIVSEISVLETNKQSASRSGAPYTLRLTANTYWK